MVNCSKYVSDKTGSVVFVRKNNQIICSETWGNAYRLIFQTKATVEYIDLDSDYSTTRVDAKADAANFAITIYVPAECGKDSKLLEITYSLTDGISEREVPSELSEGIIELGGAVSTVAELEFAIVSGSTAITLRRGAVIEVAREYLLPENVTIVGNGATIKRANGYEGIILSMRQGCKIVDLIIDGNRENMSNPTWDKTIEISTRDNCVVENVRIVNGNEAIIVYGDDVIVKGCKITNCGGNGIHFSGASRPHVENCVVIGANLRNGMGHEDGCIIWSNECNGAVCIGNYCEGGKTGFGAIDMDSNSELKIIGNTVKNCTNAVHGEFQVSCPRDIIIAGNFFYDSGRLVLAKVNNQLASKGRVIVSNNQFISTSVDVRTLSNVIVANNIVHKGRISLYYSANSRINNNIVQNPLDDIGIYIDRCINAIVSENTAKAKVYAFYTSASPNLQVCNNNFKQSYGATNRVMQFAGGTSGAYIFGNRIAAFYDAFSLGSYGTLVNNIIDCATSAINAIVIYGGVTNALATGNRTNGVITNNAGDAAGVIENNLPLDSSAFITITTELTNLTSDAPPMDTVGDELIVTLTPSDGYKLPESVSVTIADVKADLGAYAYNAATGVVTIHATKGDVNIAASGIAIY